MSQIIYGVGRGVLTVEDVVAHRVSLLSLIKPLRELLKPVVDASWMVVGAHRGWWAFMDVGRCWLVGTRPLSSMGGGDRLRLLWIAVGACGW